MGTTVHLPPRLIAAALRKAQALGVSRNRVVILALEAFVRDETEERLWDLTDRLQPAAPEVARCIDALLPEVDDTAPEGGAS